MAHPNWQVARLERTFDPDKPYSAVKCVMRDGDGVPYQGRIRAFDPTVRPPHLQNYIDANRRVHSRPDFTR